MRQKPFRDFATELPIISFNCFLNNLSIYLCFLGRRRIWRAFTYASISRCIIISLFFDFSSWCRREKALHSLYNYFTECCCAMRVMKAARQVRAFWYYYYSPDGRAKAFSALLRIIFAFSFTAEVTILIKNDLFWSAGSRKAAADAIRAMSFCVDARIDISAFRACAYEDEFDKSRCASIYDKFRLCYFLLILYAAARYD